MNQYTFSSIMAITSTRSTSYLREIIINLHLWGLHQTQNVGNILSEDKVYTNRQTVNSWVNYIKKTGTLERKHNSIKTARKLNDDQLDYIEISPRGKQ